MCIKLKKPLRVPYKAQPLKLLRPWHNRGCWQWFLQSLWDANGRCCFHHLTLRRPRHRDMIRPSCDGGDCFLFVGSKWNPRDEGRFLNNWKAVIYSPVGINLAALSGRLERWLSLYWMWMFFFFSRLSRHWFNSTCFGSAILSHCSTIPQPLLRLQQQWESAHPEIPITPGWKWRLLADLPKGFGMIALRIRLKLNDHEWPCSLSWVLMPFNWSLELFANHDDGFIYQLNLFKVGVFPRFPGKSTWFLIHQPW